MADRRILTGRPPLTYQRIASAAVHYIDESGLASLTMRAVGDALGVEAMSIYRHVPGKDRLLHAVVEQMVAEMSQDGDTHPGCSESWQEFLQRLAHGVRRVALTHPQAFTLVASLPTEAPGVRPPLRTSLWAESFLACLVEHGFSDSAAAEAYRSFTAFLLGQLLLEAGAGQVCGPGDEQGMGPLQPDPAGSLSAFPHLRRMQADLTAARAAAEFDEALHNLISQLAHKVPG